MYSCLQIITLSLRLDPLIWHSCFSMQLFRSILNYLTNACKYTEKGSIHLRIYTRQAGDRELSEIELGGLPGSLMTPMTDVLVVECEDTGEGIGLEKLATLFTPLEDVESSDLDPESKVHSSGLGLYSVAIGKSTKIFIMTQYDADAVTKK